MQGFILLFAAAIYLSPLSCGSANEKTTIKNPLELPMGNAGAGAGSSAPTTSASAPRVGKLMQDEQI